MSCNPAIGGIGKGHLVKEVDALGGAMAIATTKPASSFACSTPARGRRFARPARRRTACCTASDPPPARNAAETLTLFQQPVDDLLAGRRSGHRRDHRRSAWSSSADAVVLTTGTFLSGLIHVGRSNTRPGAPAIRRPSGSARAARARFAGRPPQDRHAAAARRPDDRLRRA